MDPLTPLTSKRAVIFTPFFYAKIFFGIGFVTIAMFWVYEQAADLTLTVLTNARSLNVSRLGTAYTRRPVETFSDQPMVRMKDHFNMTNIWKVRDITRKYFDPKKHIIYFSDYNIFEEKCDPETFTLRDSPQSPCNVVQTPIKHYRTCAVVGNSGILLHSSCGAEIDAHEFVIRFNLAPLRPFLRDVGSRTNLTIVNGKQLTEISQLLRQVLGGTSAIAGPHLRVFDPPGMIFSYAMAFKEKRWLQMQVVETAIKLYNKPTITAFPATSFQDSKRVYKELAGIEWDFPSTGLNSFALASTFCDRISMYGFYPMPMYQGERFFYHYYDQHTPSESHDFDGEYALLRQLDADGVIRHVVGKCKPDAPT
ncbi:PREDICTED: alpha-2,8-sialyltransferase 8B-like [Branchiostoma belcheri]|uniref:Alpha-2,8-sialyltransferase 8B-like n=1 Tax=Branchiostoma belcheri TaxID=7741 RepID=A0A6P4YYW3_BRABE|nr:PREDICTED: alpha-2,8-sialyltransferase 8B-like [Branchiostoma belcheri]